ncbi:unnamed protein product [marine sediment metagenome]|uniref:Uncharacterized protein n=1 Tax=marine sediment metagenome TaxID=412755 RepID=X0SER4_9ZZZZ
MNKKTTLSIIGIAVIILLMGICAYPVYQNLQSQEIKVSLKAPRECRIGELVTFDASGNRIEDITWNISPLTSNFKIIDDGKQAIFSSEGVGVYTVTIAIANNNEVNLIITDLTVSGNNVVNDKVRTLIDRAVDPSPKKIKNLINTLVDPNPDSPLNNLIDKIPMPLLLPEGEEQVNIDAWLPSERKPLQMRRTVRSLTVLVNLMDKDDFETKDEIVQAVLWGIKRTTKEDATWEPFILNFSKYIEDTATKQECIIRVKRVLISLQQVDNAKT